jgi:hypothetical protein
MALCKDLTHYGPRSGFPYYNRTSLSGCQIVDTVDPSLPSFLYSLYNVHVYTCTHPESCNTKKMYNTNSMLGCLNRNFGRFFFLLV